MSQLTTSPEEVTNRRSSAERFPTNQLVRFRNRVSAAFSTSCCVSGMTAKLNLVSATAPDIFAYAMCTFRSQAASLVLLTRIVGSSMHGCPWTTRMLGTRNGRQPS